MEKRPNWYCRPFAAALRATDCAQCKPRLVRTKVAHFLVPGSSRRFDPPAASHSGRLRIILDQLVH